MSIIIIKDIQDDPYEKILIAERKIIMGEMTVKGYAERTVDCDVICYVLKFIGEGSSIPEATKRSSDELEHFLKIMEENGIGSELFELGDNSTSKKYRSDNEKQSYESNRVITVKMALNTANADAIMQYISEYQINVELTDTYSYSQKAELHKELLKEAVDDSRAKAEIIASCTGQRIKGIKSVDTDFSSREKHTILEDYGEFFNMIGIKSCGTSRAQKLSSPTITEKEEVEVVWLIED